MNRAARTLLAGSLLMSGLSGCSKALTDSSAVRIVQKYIDAQPKFSDRSLGHMVVVSCDHPLLVIETLATATCRWHMELTKAGELRFPGTPTNGSGVVSFGKQANGTWVATGMQ
jgi:hypothetical protein